MANIRTCIELRSPLQEDCSSSYHMNLPQKASRCALYDKNIMKTITEGKVLRELLFIHLDHVAISLYID